MLVYRFGETEILSSPTYSTSMIQNSSLFCNLAEGIDSDAIDKSVDRCLGEIQQAKKPVGTGGLVQALLGKAVELR